MSMSLFYSNPEGGCGGQFFSFRFHTSPFSQWLDRIVYNLLDLFPANLRPPSLHTYFSFFSDIKRVQYVLKKEMGPLDFCQKTYNWLHADQHSMQLDSALTYTTWSQTLRWLTLHELRLSNGQRVRLFADYCNTARSQKIFRKSKIY